jgi:hypothetical protein
MYNVISFIGIFILRAIAWLFSGFWALLAATLACLMIAAVAGTFYSQN